VKDVLQAQVMCERNKITLLLQGKHVTLLRGTLLGGAWNIFVCCRGMGEHCFVQDYCCEQSEAMRGTTLQEDHNKTITKVLLRKERC
jgi:hypothetical protein